MSVACILSYLLGSNKYCVLFPVNSMQKKNELDKLDYYL